MRSSQKGFTLIEILITLGILSVITVFTTQSIRQAIVAKMKIQSQIDDVSRMRDALRLIDADINQAFHYRDVEKEIADLVKKGSTQQGSALPGAAAAFAQAQAQPTPIVEAPRVDPVTHFVGASDSVNFVTMNNARTVRNMKQADFMEVGYSLKSCKSLGGDQGSSQCLWRRTSPWVDEDVTKGGDEVVLLENVSEFKLKYIGKGKDDWVSEWRSDSGGDAVTKNKFPATVEISLTVKHDVAGKKKEYSMQIVSQVRFPNNEDTTNATNANSAPNSQ